jgi:phospholipid/cholesterol/gamma-HCH transport system permease protein
VVAKPVPPIPPVLVPVIQPLRVLGAKLSSPVMQLGHMLIFAGRALAGIPVVLKSYRQEYTRLLSDVAWGNGSLVVGGGTAGVALVLGIVVGVMVGIEGYNFLQLLGLGPAVGIISSLVNTRELAPIAAALAFATQSGCRFTAQLGAMRISEEIDALEVMGIKSISYLVSTRLVAASVVIIPLYAMSLIMAFLAAQLTTTVLYGQSTGTYLHYFHTFLRAEDVFWSFIVVIVISVFVMINHCYFGYNASGGPVGVGEAVGKSMRASLVLIQFVVLFASLALYGTNPNFNLTV